MGKDDDWTPLSRCKALLAAQEDAYKKNVSLIAYDNAYHDFDDSSKEPAEEYDGHFLAFNKEAAAQSINEAKTFFARYLD
jgi:dienelactone hydrolase